MGMTSRDYCTIFSLSCEVPGLLQEISRFQGGRQLKLLHIVGKVMKGPG